MTAFAVTNPVVAKATSGNFNANTDAYVVRLGERLARSGALTAKPTRGTELLQSVNPFAPVPPAPATPWLSRTAWAVAAPEAAAALTPPEGRHEPHFGVVIATR